MQKNKKPSEGEANILVAIRIRPLNSKQTGNGDYDIIRVQDSVMVILDPIQMQFEAENKKMLEVYHRSKEQQYAFDKIYKDHSSEEIYEQTVKPLIRTVLNGYNATVFAYGPTGTGKTHTMLGNQEVYGLNVLAINNIFDEIRKDDEFDYTVIITYVEIYNEMIRDLLIPSSGYLELRDDPEKGIVIAGVTQFRAESTQQVMNLLLLGNKRRTTQATNANQTSSRSHAVFQITCLKVSKTKSTNVETLVGKLSLIDLAGSERGTVTENRGIRLMEGAKINRSLLALANCINALGDKNKKGFFVPYRDSKLTRLLKDSLGGNCKTVMIATVSPASAQFQETINTLKYANRAKNIKTKQVSNKKLVSIHISQYKNIINDLKQQIQQLKLKLHEKGDNALMNSDVMNEKKVHERLKSQTPACSCGRGQEQDEMKKIEEEIFQNFNERIQLRRALMELEEQNALNILEIKRRQGEMLLLRKGDPQDDDQDRRISDEIEQHQKAIATLKMSTVKNNIKKQLMNVNLMESMTMTKKIRDDITKRIKFHNNREFLELIIKNHVFELQNIELEINLQIQQKIIGDLKNIVVAQKKTISDHGIQTLKIEDEFPDNDEVELEIQGDDYLNGEEMSDPDDDDELEEYKLLVRGKDKDRQTKEQDRMNIHFEKQKKDDKKDQKRDQKKQKSNNKMYFEKRSLDENFSDYDDSRSDKKVKDKGGKVQQNYHAPSGVKPTPSSNSNNNGTNNIGNNNDFGIVGQTALKNAGKKQPSVVPQQQFKMDKQRTNEKANPMELNLKGKNIYMANAFSKQKRKKM